MAIESNQYKNNPESKTAYKKRFHPALKAAAFVIIIALTVTGILGFFNIYQNSPMRGWMCYLGTEDFTQTDMYNSYVYSAHDELRQLASALSGETPVYVIDEIQSLFRNVEDRIKDNMTEKYKKEISHNELWDTFMYSYYDRDVDLGEPEEVFKRYEEQIRQNLSETYREEISEEAVWEVFLEEYADEIKNIKKRAEETGLTPYIENLKSYDVVYYAENLDTGEIASNTSLDFDKIEGKYKNLIIEEYIPHSEYTGYDYPEYDSYCYDCEYGIAHEHFVNESAIVYRIYESFAEKGDTVRYILAVEPKFIAEQDAELSAAKGAARKHIVTAGIWGLAYLICFVYLVYSAGRRATSSGVTLNISDKLFTEFTLGLIVLITFGVLYNCRQFIYSDYSNTLACFIYGSVLALLFTVLYTMFLSLVRHIKNRTFFKNFLIYKIGAKLVKVVGFLYSKGNPMMKIVIMVTVLGILTMIPFVGFVTVPLALFIAYRHAKDFKKLKDGVQSVKNGNYTDSINISRIYSEFALLADDINRISAGLGDEVERRLKSERLKTELIINVSHDLRTPLTSLITYADLLKKEQTDNENIVKYAEIISQKSGRLKVLTDDLFESAKAASGNVSVNLEKVDVNALLIQSIAEFDDKIRQSDLEFKLTVPEEPLYAHADGRLLWRVIENLISNALRYSLENSRVYVGAYSENNCVLVEVKNISKAELNIPEDEVTERFKRGDLSRNSEGSGLGLDIASSLMTCQGGELKVRIDGDLFKVCIEISAYK